MSLRKLGSEVRNGSMVNDGCIKLCIIAAYSIRRHESEGFNTEQEKGWSMVELAEQSLECD